MIEFRPASAEDAEIIVHTRRKAWDAVYRGIYPDGEIDNFDFHRHLQMERQRLGSPDFHCFLVMEDAECVGYFSYGKKLWDIHSFCLHSLYLLPCAQKKGIGRQIFEKIRTACLTEGWDTMYLNCNPHNRNALGFYRHMGGTVAYVDAGHKNPQEDSCVIEYHFT